MNGPVAATLTIDSLRVDVHEGTSLLAGLRHGPSLRAHRALRGTLSQRMLPDLVALARSLHGRGGAGFPLARKLEGLAGARQPPVVVNASEGEPASAKDGALVVLAPHLVLDGAIAAAHALGSRQVHLVVPEERPAVGHAITKALAERERQDGRLRFRLHQAQPGFVSGQSSAVLELIEGRENKPVSSWEPATVSGLHGRPTLLSNAETFAQLAALLLRPMGPPGLTDEPGTTLLTVVLGDARPLVCEVEMGTPWRDVLGDEVLGRPVLMGGYHGCWVPPDTLSGLTVSRGDLARHGLTLGAGVVMMTPGCPVARTARIVRYLAAESAGRCGPCVRGLPTLAHLMAELASGRGEVEAIDRIMGLVDGRGACAHPDGTARLVRSLLTSYASEIDMHGRGRCEYAASAVG